MFKKIFDESFKSSDAIPFFRNSSFQMFFPESDLIDIGMADGLISIPPDQIVNSFFIIW
jgi:hypothetical protein